MKSRSRSLSPRMPRPFIMIISRDGGGLNGERDRDRERWWREPPRRSMYVGMTSEVDARDAGRGGEMGRWRGCLGLPFRFVRRRC